MSQAVNIRCFSVLLHLDVQGLGRGLMEASKLLSSTCTANLWSLIDAIDYNRRDIGEVLIVLTMHDARLDHTTRVSV